MLPGTEHYNLDNAIGLAIDFQMPINFYYSTSPGSCKRPQKFQSFNDLAEESNGQELLFTNATGISKMGAITAAALDGLTTIAVGGSTVRRSKRAVGKPNKLYNIPVDESMDKLIVTVTTVSSGKVAHVKLQNHLGKLVPKTENLELGCVWVIDSPNPGNWILIVPKHIGTHSFKVTASSVSNINFEHYFVHKIRGSKLEVLLDHPLRGKGF